MGQTPFNVQNGFGPPPAGYMGGAVPPPTQPDQRPSERQRSLDPRVRWATETKTALQAERQVITARMKKSMDLARGKHWSSSRAPWKSASKINYCQWVPEQWSSILADNKPRASYSAYHEHEQWKADIATAAWEEWWTEEDIQTKVEDAIYLSRIEGKAFLRLTYDPLKRSGEGNQNATVVAGHQVFVNREATSVDDATLLMYEYVESEGTVLYHYPHLNGRLDGADRADGDYYDMVALQQSPRMFVTTPTDPVGYHLPSYEGPAAQDGNNGGTGGLIVREYWTRPRGPQHQTTVQMLAYNALNQPITKIKVIQFEDGHQEPLQWVVTEGNVMYELPYSAVVLMQEAEKVGGPKVLKVADALEAEVRDVTVPLYPTGRRLVVVGNEVACDTCNPFAHGQFPFIEFDAHRDPTKFFGMGDIDLIADLQEYLNRLYSLLLDAAILTSNPVWIIPQSTELQDEDITNAPGAIIRVDPMFLKAGNRRQGPEMPQYVKELLNFTIQQIREISGLTEVATGGKFKGQQSAETVSMYQEAAGVRFRQGIRHVERAIVKMGHQFIKNAGQFYGQPRLVRLEMVAGQDRTETFIGTALTAPMVLKTKAGSMLPTSPSARFNQIMQTLQFPFPTFDIPEVFSAMEEFGLLNSADKMMQRLEKLARTSGLPGETWKWPMFWMKLMGPPPGSKGGRKPKGRNARGAGKPPGA